MIGEDSNGPERKQRGEFRSVNVSCLSVSRSAAASLLVVAPFPCPYPVSPPFPPRSTFRLILPLTHTANLRGFGRSGSMPFRVTLWTRVSIFVPCATCTLRMRWWLHWDCAPAPTATQYNSQKAFPFEPALFFFCNLSPAESLSGSCMRAWLNISGAAEADLDSLEEKARSFHLSEDQIRDMYPLPLLQALLPVSIASQLKTCIGKVFWRIQVLF